MNGKSISKVIPKKKSTGRPKGSLGPLIPSWKRAYMFMTWCEEQNDNHVARQCHIGRQTVARYRNLEKWAERRRMILEDMKLQTGEQDEELAKRHRLQQVRILQNQAFEAVLDKGYKDGKDAATAYERFVKLEQQLMGDGPENVLGVLAIAMQQFQDAQAKVSKAVKTSFKELEHDNDA